MNRALWSSAISLVAATSGPAQNTTPDEVARLAASLRVPIHTQPRDPSGGDYGLWAAGPGFKASFHDGFAFYPRLGPKAPRHLPLAWHTRSVRVGAQELLTGHSVTRHDDFRFERYDGGVVEAYDVRLDGIEQTFTLATKPEASGDLVITGAIQTPLTVPAAGKAEHGDLEFTAEGTPVIRYGRAFAIDARGHRSEVATSCDGEHIRLVVPASVLEGAVFPLVVDPLTTAVGRQYTGSFPETPSITAQTTSTGPRLVVAWVEAATATDFDAYALLTSYDHQSGTWLYQDVTTSWSTPVVEAGYVGGGNRWVLGLQRTLTAGNQIRIYLHDAANTTMNSGTTLFPAAPTGLEQRSPAVGGSMTGSRALVVFERRDTASGLGSVMGIRVDPVAATMEPAFSFTAGFLETLTRPAVTPLAQGNTGWVVTVLGGGALRVGFAPHSGSASVATAELWPAPPLGGGITSCRVAGSDGRYLALYRITTPDLLHPGYYGDSATALRFDLAGASAAPTLLRRTPLLGASHTGSAPVIRLGGCEFDQLTRSHWAISYANATASWVDRFAYTGDRTEHQPLSEPADIAFARPGGVSGFPIAYSVATATGMTLYGRAFDYPTDAISTAYGTACATGVSVSSSPAYAGSEFFRVSANGLPAGTAAIYFLSLTSDALDLTPAGLPGCFLNVGVPWVLTLSAAATAAGQASVTYPLGDTTFDIYSQWLWFDPTASPQPFRLSRGVHHQVR